MRVVYWLPIAVGAAAVAALLLYMMWVPGRSWSSTLPPLSDDEMDLLAGKAGDRLIVSGIVRNIFSYKTLNSIAGVRAAKKEHWRAVSFLPRKRNPDLFSIRVSPA